MSSQLIAFVGFVYLFVAFDQLKKGQTGMALAYFGYAFSNVGLYMLAAK
tara:strand:- start:2057 stop:2203 length:147 start_codon:yes stop_codon:yes gene_type:complete